MWRNNDQRNRALPLGRLVIMVLTIFFGTHTLAQCPFDAVFADDGAAGDGFGRGAAIDGDTAVVSTHDESAYVFVNTGGAWTQQAKLIADDAGGSPFNFGRAVAIEGDVIVIGASTGGVPSAGAAYVFERTGSVWTKTAKLTPDPILANPGADFGNAVAIDGNTIVVGAWLDEQVDGAITTLTTGAAYVFVNTPGASWSSMTSSIKLGGSDLESQDHFGIAVDIDDDRIVVGANENGNAPGAVYIYDQTGAWVATNLESARLAASDEEAGDEFGGSVAVSGDSVIVGARYWDAPTKPNAGAAYVFVKSTGSWSQQQRLESSNTGSSAFDFGTHVAIVDDMAIVTEPYVDHFDGLIISGSAQIFTRTGTVWSFAHELLPMDQALFTQADDVKAMGFDGSTLVLGSPDQDWTAFGAGAAFILEGLDDDCNGNGVPDACDIEDGTSLDDDGDGVPDECGSTCSEDLTGDGTVDVLDLLDMLTAWGPNPGHAADLNGDDVVNVLDLLELLTAWGAC